jgi:hypothetical protein
MFKLLVLILLINFACAQQFWSQCTFEPNIPTPHSIIAPKCDHERCRVVRGETTEPIAKIRFNAVHEELVVRVTAFVLGIGGPFYFLKINYFNE